MQRRYLISETVTHYHEISIDDEIDVEQLVDDASALKRMYDTGYEAVEAILKRYEKQYGFEYAIIPNACGTEIVSMDVSDEI